MADFLYFPFSLTDQQRIDSASVVVTDLPYASGIAPGVAQPQSMRLTFRVLDPSNGPPALRPMVPGTLQYMPGGAGALPTPADIQFLADGSLDPAPYAGWNTTGSIFVTVSDAKVAADYTALATGLEVVPNRFWYSPVVLGFDFLSQTLLNGLDKTSIVADAAAGTITKPSAAEWKGIAVSSMLGGQYTPKLNRAGGTRIQDDIAKYPMPTVVMAADGTVTLIITCARYEAFRDGPASLFDDVLAQAQDLPETDPSHPRNGMVPARHVYRKLQAGLIDRGIPGDFIAETADAMLADWPAAPRYFPIRFTRVWQPQPECSGWFMLANIQILDGNGTELLRQRMPSHGMFYLSQAPTDPDALPPFVQVALLGPLKLQSGSLDRPWMLPASTLAQPAALTTGSIPHFLARLPMHIGVVLETPDAIRDNVFCVFASLRRVVRAWIDNRICGGRLVFRTALTSAGARKLIDNSLGVVPRQNVWPSGPFGDRVAEPDLTTGLFQMRDILEIFFPAEAPVCTVGGTTDRPTVYTVGGVAYRLWLTAVEAFESNATKCNFPDEHVGRGAPAALVYLGLGHYQVNPAPAAPDAEMNGYIAVNVAEMLSGGLVSGATLQFWDRNNDYSKIVARQMLSSENLESIGHSPIFSTYLPSADAAESIVVMDHHLDWTDCPVKDGGALSWAGFEPQVWLAANWDE
ncbi:MAG: hypothetical protein IANPNBLG_02112 [Bryobacteraceae bacterium]|nr:hypothetical protein [Bryobacteraceae bacterium]